ncbi:hypothetical protein HPB47_026960, partial [Ixodes persulcatus]
EHAVFRAGCASDAGPGCITRWLPAALAREARRIRAIADDGSTTPCGVMFEEPDSVFEKLIEGICPHPDCLSGVCWESADGEVSRVNWVPPVPRWVFRICPLFVRGGTGRPILPAVVALLAGLQGSGWPVARHSSRQGMEISTSLVAAMAEPLPPDDEELASVSGSIADDNQGAFQDVVRGTKRRCPSQGSGSSEKTIITQTEPTVGLVVLFTPVDGDVRIDSTNSIRLTSTLETLVLSCFIEVRYNRRKNLQAIDTRNGQTTRTLLGQTTLCGMKVRAFEPRGKAFSVGIVRDINSTLSDSAILGVLRSTVGIRNVRRIGKSTTIRVEFASPTLLEHVYVGLVRHGVDLYVNNSIQCHRC